MKFLRSALPHICITLNISLLVVIYLDLRNPMMGFLAGAPFLALAGLCSIASIVCSSILYQDWRNRDKRTGTPKEIYQESEKISE